MPGFSVHTVSLSLLKLESVELVLPFDHLTLSPLLLLPSVFPSISAVSFPMGQFFASGGQSIGASASASKLYIVTLLI